MTLTKDEDHALGGISEWYIFVASDSNNRFVGRLYRKPTSTNIDCRSQLGFGRTATHPGVCCLVARACSHVTPTKALPLPPLLFPSTCV